VTVVNSSESTPAPAILYCSSNTGNNGSNYMYLINQSTPGVYYENLDYKTLVFSESTASRSICSQSQYQQSLFLQKLTCAAGTDGNYTLTIYLQTYVTPTQAADATATAAVTAFSTAGSGKNFTVGASLSTGGETHTYQWYKASGETAKPNTDQAAYYTTNGNGTTFTVATGTTAYYYCVIDGLYLSNVLTLNDSTVISAPTLASESAAEPTPTPTPTAQSTGA
jgi:hypothetical protein